MLNIQFHVYTESLFCACFQGTTSVKGAWCLCRVLGSLSLIFIGWTKMDSLRLTPLTVYTCQNSGQYLKSPSICFICLLLRTLRLLGILGRSHLIVFNSLLPQDGSSKGAWLETWLIFSELKEEDFNINYTCCAYSDRGFPERYFSLQPAGKNIISHLMLLTNLEDQCMFSQSVNQVIFSLKYEKERSQTDWSVGGDFSYTKQSFRAAQDCSASYHGDVLQ